MQGAHARPEGADTGEHDGGRLADEPGIVGEPGVGADVFQRLLRGSQVADAVVEDGDEGEVRHRWCP